MKRVVAAIAACAIFVSSAGSAFANDLTPVPDMYYTSPASSYTQEEYIEAAPDGLARKLLELEDDIYAFMENSLDEMLEQIEDAPLVEVYYTSMFETILDNTETVYAHMKSDISWDIEGQYEEGFWYAMSGSEYLNMLKKPLSQYKSLLSSARSYAQDPEDFRLSAEERADIQSHMIELQSVFVSAWDEYVQPYMENDYKETGDMDLSIQTDGVEISLVYETYTSMLSLLTGRQEATVEARLTFDTRPSETFPDMPEMSGVITMDLFVQQIKSEIVIRLDDMTHDIDTSALWDTEATEITTMLDTIETLKGRALRFDMEAMQDPMASEFAMPFMDANTAEYLRYADEIVHLLEEEAIFVPVMKTRSGNPLMTNPAFLRAVDDTTESYFGERVFAEDSMDADPMPIPGLLWRESVEQYELYLDMPKSEEFDGYVSLALMRDDEMLELSGNIYHPDMREMNNFEFLMNADEYSFTFNADEQISSSLRWVKGAFDFSVQTFAFYEYEEDMEFTITGVADNARVDLVAEYNGDRVATLVATTVDRTTEYDFEFSWTVPVIPFMVPNEFDLNISLEGVAEETLGNFPITPVSDAEDGEAVLEEVFGSSISWWDTPTLSDEEYLEDFLSQ